MVGFRTGRKDGRYASPNLPLGIKRHRAPTPSLAIACRAHWTAQQATNRIRAPTAGVLVEATKTGSRRPLVVFRRDGNSMTRVTNYGPSTQRPTPWRRHKP